jgi:hypothetical protein
MVIPTTGCSEAASITLPVIGKANWSVSELLQAKRRLNPIIKGYTIKRLFIEVV